MDRRKRKTQKAIKEAFIELVSQKEINEITVKEITEIADISRKTFYLNYEDMNDLISKLEDEIMNELTSYIQTFNPLELKSNPYIFLKSLSDILQKDPVFNRMLLSDPSSGILQRLKNHFKNAIILSLKNNNQIVDDAVECRATFIVCGILETYKEWYLNKNKDISLYELCQTLQTIKLG